MVIFNSYVSLPEGILEGKIMENPLIGGFPWEKYH